MGVVQISKNLGLLHNVAFRVIDELTGKVVQEHVGHNAATDSLLRGIGYYLVGNGVNNQASAMLARYVPNYISLGTLGLYSQSADADGLPTGIGLSPNLSEEDNYVQYSIQCPGYGSDGYDTSPDLLNHRAVLGLGNKFNSRKGAINCELVSDSYLRFPISFKEVISEAEAEQPQTVDVVYSAMISTGALAHFRGDNDHIFISEAGLWSTRHWVDANVNSSGTAGSPENGLLAGYRIMPPDEVNWDMHIASNRELLRRSILRVGVNQVVQVVWKIQIGSLSELTHISTSGACTHIWREY